MATKYTGPASNATVCDECGGPTYLFQSGSIWCPDEDHHAGGHFVVRVAFERAPIKTGQAVRTTRPGQGTETTAQIVARVKPTAKPVVNAGFDAGFDAFVDSEE